MKQIAYSNQEEKFSKQVERLIEEQERILAQAQKAAKNCPEGSLKVQKKGNGRYYYKRSVGQDGKAILQYLPKKNLKQIQALAHKKYFTKTLPALEKNVQILRKVQQTYQYDIINAVSMHLQDAIQEVEPPFIKEADLLLLDWEREEYEVNQRYPESLRFETSHGEMVRSKSELIIADALAQEEMLLYKYERPLQVNHQGKRITIHPDFTVFHKKTGKITYWEHAGIMDDPDYGADFVWKNNLYLENGLYQGRDVIFTYESAEHPLQLRTVRKNIDWIKEMQTSFAKIGKIDSKG